MYEFLRYRVKDVMVASPVTIAPDTTLAELEEIFEAHDFNGVPVADLDARLLGMATKFDILKAFAFGTDQMVPPYEEIMRRSVESVMTRDPRTMDPETPLTRTLQVMVEMRNKSFPVTDEGIIVGVVAREDILSALRRATDGRGPAD